MLQDTPPRPRDARGRRANLTTRVAVEGEIWVAVTVRAARAKVTVARYVGLMIESVAKPEVAEQQ